MAARNGSENIFGGKPIESLSPANYRSPTANRDYARRELPWEDSALASDLTELGQEARESLGEVGARFAKSWLQRKPWSGGSAAKRQRPEYWTVSGLYSNS